MTFSPSSDTKELRRKVNRRVASYQAARQRHRMEKEALQQVQERKTALATALSLAQAVAKQVQEEAHARIADIVSRCLEAVFDEPYQFKIHFEVKRGKTEASLVFERNGVEVDPMTASGGGVVDVAAFALRLSCLMLSRPPLRRLLVLDEPFRFLSEEYRGRAKDLILKLAQEMGVQFVIVTHIRELECGTVVRL